LTSDFEHQRKSKHGKSLALQFAVSRLGRPKIRRHKRWQVSGQGLLSPVELRRGIILWFFIHIANQKVQIATDIVRYDFSLKMFGYGRERNREMAEKCLV
jgi:hypothetical protein